MWLLITGLMLLASTGSGSVLAPYQVSIRSSAPPIVGLSNDGGSVPSRHICSGIIIKDKYILTTAGCVHVREPQTGRVTRLINPGETFIVAGNLTVSGTAGTGTNSIVRRNVISVIPHEAFNATSGEHDIALLKLDRSLPLQNSSLRWIELQGPPPNVTTATSGTGGQTTTAATASNKVNENCFINIYNNSVGPSNYPYTVVRNVSFFDKWICDERSKGSTNGRSDGRCVEYRFSASQSCLLNPDVLRQSEERGTALVCNFKLAAILAEINPPANAGQCVAQRRTTAYYTPIEPHLGWIVKAIGNLWTVAQPPQPSLPASGGGSTSASGQALAPGFVPGPVGPGSSWGAQQPVAAGNPKSAAVAAFCSGTALKVFLFNLFISLTVIYRFRH
uniref:Putative trypsin-like serine protease n=1 Tax=Culex tarsalis TaxID=7177 RepID=A0A1Q3FPW3_CULTA